jgi:hypothetical protein
VVERRARTGYPIAGAGSRAGGRIGSVQQCKYHLLSQSNSGFRSSPTLAILCQGQPYFSTDCGVIVSSDISEALDTFPVRKSIAKSFPILAQAHIATCLLRCRFGPPPLGSTSLSSTDRPGETGGLYKADLRDALHGGPGVE